MSIVMAAYNAENYIKDAIESVLNQTYRDFELIIVNDGSTDGTAETVRLFSDNRIVFIDRKRNMNVGYTWREGLRYCTGDYFCFADADDIARSDRLEISVEYLKKNNDCLAVCGRFQEMKENGELVNCFSPYFYNPMYMKARMLYENVIANGSICARMDAVRKAGIVEGIKFGEDYRLWFDVMCQGEIHMLENVMYYYRIYDKNTTNMMKKQEIFESVSNTWDYIRKKMGIQLSKKESETLDYVLFYKSLDSFEDIKTLYEILMKICILSKKQKIDCCSEIVSSSRWIFSDVLFKSKKIWEEYECKNSLDLTGDQL